MIWLVSKYSNSHNINFLEIGPGTGKFISEVHRRQPSWNFFALEGTKSGCELCARNAPFCDLIHGSLLEYETSASPKFDVICLFDVLEHIKHDSQALK